MPNFTQATTAAVIDAGRVRGAELGRRLKYLRDNHQPTTEVVRSIIDLHQKMEALALSTSITDQYVLKRYLQETYGLLAVYTDPLLRPLLPTVPATGATVKPLIWAFNGSPITFNGNLVGVGAILVPAAGVTYNTVLLPEGQVGTVAFGGLPETEFAFDGPAPLTGRALFLRLYVGMVQVGRIDFTSPLLGAGFSLLYDGQTYYGTFQETLDNTLLLG